MGEGCPCCPFKPGQEGTVSGVGSSLFSPHPASHRHRPLTRQRCHRVRGSCTVHFSSGVGSSMLVLGVAAEYSVFPDPRLSSPPVHSS